MRTGVTAVHLDKSKSDGNSTASNAAGSLSIRILNSKILDIGKHVVSLYFVECLSPRLAAVILRLWGQGRLEYSHNCDQYDSS